MSNNTVVNQATNPGDTIATEDIGGVKHELVKLEFGAAGIATLVSASDPLPVTVTNTVTIAEPVSIDDNGGSITVDGAVKIVDGTGDSCMDDANNALRVNIIAGAGSGGTAMTDDTGFTPGSNSITPAGGIYRSVRDSVDDNDAGALAMTQTRALYTSIETPNGDSAMDEANDALRVNIVAGSSAGTEYTEDDASAANPSGGQLISRRRDALVSEVTADGDVIAVNATAKGELYVKHVDSIPVTDNAGSLTVDNPALSVVGGGAEATALRVTIASDSTGVLSIDDNGGSLTVDGSVSISGTATVAGTVTADAGTGFPSVQTEDAAAAGGETGIMVLGVRNDAAASKTSADGDFSAIAVDSAGRVGITDLGGAISIDDNGSSITVDGSVTASDGGGSLTVDAPVGTPVNVQIGDGTRTATVRDTGTSDSLNVAIVDGSGNQITSFGGGTQYTEDDASAANPVGNQLLGRRRDALAGETTADGDVVALNATDKGELYVKHVDAIPITDNAGSLTVDNATLSVVGGGTEATALRVTVASDSTGVLSVDDNGASLTIDNAALSVTGGGAEATALRVTIASDSTGVLSVDDNGGSLTVDGSVTVSGTVTANAGTGFPSVQTEDAASAGGETGLMILGVRNDAANTLTSAIGDFSAIAVDYAGRIGISDLGGTISIDDSLGSLTVDSPTLDISGGGTESGALRVTIASDSTGVLSVDDNGGSLTIDNATLAVVGGGTEAAALRVTIANDSTGVLSIDDNGSSITVDGTVSVSGTVTVGGVAANDAAVSGNPVLVAGRASDAVPTAVSADGDVVYAWLDKRGAVKIAVVDDAGDSAMDGANNALRVNVVAGGAGDGSILDGVSSSIKASVLDYTNSNPLAVRLTDTNGDYVGAGAGTQYVEDVAAAADPTGTALIMVRKDTLAGLTSADGDNVAARGTDKGELYVKHVDTIPVTDNGGSLTIDNATLSVVGGGTEATALRVTIASDSTGVLSIDDNGSSITVDGSVTVADGGGSITVDAPVGTPVNVQIGDGTRTATVRDTGTSDSLNVAIVDASGNQITTFGGGTEYTEDAASAANPVGGQVMARRRDALAGETSADGDVVALNATDKGELYVKHVDAIPITDNAGSLTVDNATLSVVGGGTEATALRVTIASDSTGVLSVDDNGSSLTVDGTVTANAGTGFPSVQTEDAASAGGETGIMILGVRNDAAASKTTTDGDFSAIATDAAGRVGIADLGGAISVDDNGSSLTIDNAALSVVGGGAEATALRVTIANDSTGVLSVDDNGSSLTVDGTVTANAGTGTFTVGGVAANDAAVSGNPVLIAGRASDAVPTAVSADGDVVYAWLDKRGAAKIAVVDDAGDSAMDGANNALRVNVVAGGAGDGSILDGVSSSIKASVLDYTNSNPLAVRLTDTNGDYVTAGGGTQYTEDAAAAADPIGNALIMVRKDSLAGLTSADGDNVAARGTDKGELYVKHVDAIPITDNAGSLTVDGTITANAGTGFPSVQTEDAAAAGGETGIMILGVRNDSAVLKTSADGDFSAISVDAMGRIGIADLGGTISIDDDGLSITVDNSTLSVTGGGVEASALRVTIASDSTGVLSVDDNGGSLTVDGSGTFTVGGVAAHDAAVSGNPVRVGGYAANALPTAVANGDTANLITDLWGRLLVAGIDPAQQITKVINVTTTQTGSDVWSPTSGKKIAITHLYVAAYATTTARVILWFGDNADTTYTAGTDQAAYIASFAPSSTSKPGALPMGGAIIPIFCTTADRELHLTTDAAISLDIIVIGYEW